MSSQKLSVYNLKINGEISWSSLIEKLLLCNVEEERFIINEQSETYIGGYYMIETVHNQIQYNSNNNNFEQIPVKRINIIKFDIYTLKSTILLWGSKKVIPFFLTAVEKASDYSIILDYRESDFKKMIESLLTDPIIVFNNMRITYLVIENGIVANCSVNLRILDDSREMVKKYISKLSQVGVSVGEQESAVSMTIYSSGAVVVYKDRDDISYEVMDTLNKMLGGVM